MSEQNVITLERAKELAHQAVAREGENHTTYCSIAKPSNVAVGVEPNFSTPEWEIIDNKYARQEARVFYGVTIEPLCVVGHMIDIEVGREKFQEVNNGTVWGPWNSVGYILDEEADNFMRTLQTWQDAGFTWGYALEMAKSGTEYAGQKPDGTTDPEWDM